MSRQGLFDEPFAAEEDLFFHKLFSEDEFSQNRASKMTSSFKQFTHNVPPPPNFSQLLFSQVTQKPTYTSQSKTVAKVQPHATKPSASRGVFSGNSRSIIRKPCEILTGQRHKIDDTVFSQHSSPIKNYNVNEGDMNFEGQNLYDDKYPSATNVTAFQTPSQMAINLPSRGSNRSQQLRSVAEIPEPFRTIFSAFPYFNFVQSKVLDDVLYTDKPVVVCSPTGSGKTVVFELAIIRLMMNFLDRAKNFKIVYMAPMKALCSERYEDWSKKFGTIGMKCKELTGDSEMDDYLELQSANIVMTTPEKWDSMTRKWKDNRSLVQAVKLFLIDEVHLLNDESRGPIMEAVISRMKTVKTAESRASNQKEIFGANMRFLAISATIPNAEDIGKWLETEKRPAATYSMDDSYRPVKLHKVVIGYTCSEGTSNFRFDLSLNYKLSSIIQKYSENKPTLVFCSTRKGTQQAASTLIKDNRFVMNSEHRQRLQRCANSLHDSKLRELVMSGVAYHHAGLDSSDRKSIEAMFTNGELPVLFATSTLAMGVNLPAHLVIIKSTMQYVKGVFEEYAESQILQMTGRAGRPQFDDSATAVIMTKDCNKKKYEAIIGGTQNIESSLHKNLIEHLNAEIVLNTITDVSIALEWLKSTFLYIRILKNPIYYGIPEGLDMDVLEKKLQEMCVESLNTLRDHGLVNIDEGIDLKATDTGKLMARYCLAFESIKLFLALEGDEDLNELVKVVCRCKEFVDLKLRNNEKRVLNTLNKDKNQVTIRFPINGKIKTTEQKINCLFQATLGCLPINEFSLNQDVTKIFRSGQRVSKCLQEFCMLQTNYNLLMNALQLSKCFRSRIWENSKYVSKQIEKVGLTLSTMLVNAGLTTFQKIEETNPREIELILNRHPPFGNQVKEAVARLPKYEVDIVQKSNYSVSRAELVISVTMVNYIKRQDSGKSTGFHYCIVLIADADNHIVHKQRLSDAVFFNTGTWSKRIEVKRAYSSSELTINVISQDIVGVDSQKKFTPYYTGPNIDHRRPLGFERNNTPVKVAPEDTERKTQPQEEKRQPCNHRCINKHLCAHECCKIGTIAKKSEPKETSVNQRASKTPNKENARRTRESKLNVFVNQLHARNQSIPTTPGRKRLMGYSNADDFHCSRSEKGGSILSQYEYKRKEKCPRLDVQQNADTEDFDIQDFDIHDFDDSEWPDVEFYADAHQEKGCDFPDTIDLTDDVWDENCYKEEDDDDDWYLEYSFLDDKPKQAPKENDQLLDANTEHNSRIIPETYRKKSQNIRTYKSNQVALKPNSGNNYTQSRQVKPNLSNECMTKMSSAAFPMPDLTHQLMCSTQNQNKQTIADQPPTRTNQPPKPSPSKLNLSRPLTLSHKNNHSDIRAPNSTSNRSNFTWPYVTGPKKGSLTTPSKIDRYGEFVTAADVAETRKQAHNETSHSGRSVYTDHFSFNDNGAKNGPQNNFGPRQTQTPVQETRPWSRYFNSNPNIEKSEVNAHLTRKHNTTIDQDVVSQVRQNPNHGYGEQSIHLSSPEYNNSQEHSIPSNIDTQGFIANARGPTSVEETAITRAFYKPGSRSVHHERPPNSMLDGEANASSWEKSVTISVLLKRFSFNSSTSSFNACEGVSDDEENRDAFKNIFTDVF